MEPPEYSQEHGLTWWGFLIMSLPAVASGLWAQAPGLSTGTSGPCVTSGMQRALRTGLPNGFSKAVALSVVVRCPSHARQAIIVERLWHTFGA